ncbi:hypothetical protein [Sinorhizobium meliloti]|nr:hypothetical protein [Sinorhizobium meliloti]
MREWIALAVGYVVGFFLTFGYTYVKNVVARTGNTRARRTKTSSRSPRG